MSLALRLALRELRGGLTGLRLLAVCIVLGVTALAGVGSLSSAITQGLESVPVYEGQIDPDFRSFDR